MTPLERALKKAGEDDRTAFLMGMSHLLDRAATNLLVLVVAALFVSMLGSFAWPTNYVAAALIVVYGLRATSAELNRRARAEIFQQNKK